MAPFQFAILGWVILICPLREHHTVRGRCCVFVVQLCLCVRATSNPLYPYCAFCLPCVYAYGGAYYKHFLFLTVHALLLLQNADLVAAVGVPCLSHRKVRAQLHQLLVLQRQSLLVGQLELLILKIRGQVQGQC